MAAMTMMTAAIAAAGRIVPLPPARAWLAVAALLLAGLAAALPRESAGAHANLARSVPAANSVLALSPARVTMWFTEPMEARYSEARVLNSAGERVDGGDSIVDAADPTVMSVGLPPALPNGTYTVAWRNLSTVDGHRIRGVFAFSVGEPISPAAAVPAETALLQSASEPWLRWGALLSAMALAGGLAFRPLVSGAVIYTAARTSPVGRLRGRLHSRMRRMLRFSAIALLAVSAGQLLTQTAAALDISVWAAAGAPSLELLTQTDWGGLWLWRVGLALAALALTMAPSGVRLRWARGLRLDGAARWLALAAALGVLLTFSMTSHAAATPGIARLALVNDFVHLCAAAVWVGGLFGFAAGTPLFAGGLPESARRVALSRLTRRFSVVALLSVCVLGVTGAFSAWAQVTEFAALAATPYGMALLAKVGVIAPLLALGAVNLVWVRPRLRGSGRAARWLRRLVAGEIALAALALLAVGFMTSLEPARQTASRLGIGQPSALEFVDEVDGARVALSVAPGTVGVNTITATLTDALTGAAIDNAADVRLRVSYLDADFGEEAASAVNVGGGRYVLGDALIGIAGAWQVDVLAQRPDAFDARAAFRFETRSGGSAAITPDAADAPIYFGVAFGLLGFLLLASGVPMGGWYSRAGAAAMGAGAAALIVAGAVALSGQGADDAAAAARNPILPTSDSVNAGRVVYERYCLSCHGEGGRGDGAGGAGLEPPPADLVVHAPLHPDAALFGFISDGIAGTAMAPLGDRLSAEEIWHAVNYIRALSEEG